MAPTSCLTARSTWRATASGRTAAPPADEASAKLLQLRRPWPPEPARTQRAATSRASRRHCRQLEICGGVCGHQKGRGEGGGCLLHRLRTILMFSRQAKKKKTTSPTVPALSPTAVLIRLLGASLPGADGTGCFHLDMKVAILRRISHCYSTSPTERQRARLCLFGTPDDASTSICAPATRTHPL